MTSTTEFQVAVIGTGLIGTSVALAAGRVGCRVRGWDVDPEQAARAATSDGPERAGSLEEAVDGADVVVVAAPLPVIPDLVVRSLRSADHAVVTDVGSVKTPLIEAVRAKAAPERFARYVPGHPMGGSERSGPEHASASIVDGIVWVLTPTDASDPGMVERLESWVGAIGGGPVRMSPARHDRLVAVVSHLPQVASTALMSLAATEEADEPEILLLAAGGFLVISPVSPRRIPASGATSSCPTGERSGMPSICTSGDSCGCARRSTAERSTDVEATFEQAKAARLRLAAKPKVRAGVAVLQVALPDRPGALAHLTAALGDGDVNIEDLQIVHSPEGGRGTVHLTVAADDAGAAADVLDGAGFDPVRLA